MVLGAAWIAWPYWGAQLPPGVRNALAPVMDAGRPSAAADRLDSLETRIAALETSLNRVRSENAKALSDAVAQLNSRIEAAGETAPLAKRLGELEQRVAALAAASGSSDGPSTQAVEALMEANRAQKERLSALESQLQELASRPPPEPAGPGAANALLLAVGQLRQAVQGPGSYAATYDAVAALAGSAEGTAEPLKVLAAHKGGVPDLPALRARFADTASAIVRATVVPRGEGWVDRTLDSLASLVEVRKRGETAAAENSVQGLVARAELRLADGDLKGAVAALEKLEGAPADAAQGWLDDAQARLAVEGAVDALMRDALVRAKS